MDSHLPFLGWSFTNPIMGRNSTRGQGVGIRDKGQGIRPKRSLTLKTKSCFLFFSHGRVLEEFSLLKKKEENYMA